MGARTAGPTGEAGCVTPANPEASRVYVGIRTVSESNQRGNSRVAAIIKHRRAQKQRQQVAGALMATFGLKTRPAPHVVVLTRIAPRALDDDNLRGALKTTRDEVASFIGLDDRDPRVEWMYAQRRGKPREYAVEITFA